MAFSKATIGAGASANAASPAGLSKGPGTVAGWEPTVLYMLGFIVGEIILVAILGRMLLKG